MIGESIKIKGEVTGNEDLIVAGELEGVVNLSGQNLTVAMSGTVLANIEAKSVKIEGVVTGDINGSELVVVSKSGRVQGNITAPRVTLEDGAKFKGSIDMDPGQAALSAAHISIESVKPSKELKA